MIATILAAILGLGYCVFLFINLIIEYRRYKKDVRKYQNATERENRTSQD